jgi:hypothetical protein
LQPNYRRVGRWTCDQLNGMSGAPRNGSQQVTYRKSVFDTSVKPSRSAL